LTQRVVAAERKRKGRGMPGQARARAIAAGAAALDRIGLSLESSRAMFWNSTCERMTGSPGRRQQMPRTIRSIRTPACGAA
jgi:hypothetical protein